MFRLNKKKKLIQFRKDRGFSLLEVVVAVSIMMISFIGITKSFPFGMSINNSAKSKTQASYLAQEKIEELYSMGYDNIATGTLESKKLLSTSSDSFLNKYKRTTEVQNVDESFSEVSSSTGMKKISVSVFYRDAITRKEESINMNSLISKH